MLVKIKLYNSGERGNIERELEIAVPTLFKVGLFDLFPSDEWIKGGNPGARLRRRTHQKKHPTNQSGK
jgi:hypothetical protein